MAYVVLHLPFLQTNFACQNRIGTMFDLKTTAFIEQARRYRILVSFVTLILAIASVLTED